MQNGMRVVYGMDKNILLLSQIDLDSVWNPYLTCVLRYKASDLSFICKLWLAKNV